MTVYTAPAVRVLTDVHIQDPDAPPVPGTAGDPGTDGATACELPMYRSEIWVSVELRPGDRICRACLEPGSAPGQQEEALW